MVRCWYACDAEGRDQRGELQLDPPQPLELAALREVTGVEYFKVNADDYENDPVLKRLREERGYDYQDIVNISRDTMPNYDEKLKIFFAEHLHTDEEIRLALEGSGYFDLRDRNDRWVRVFLEKGDMIIVPAGIYHRFTLDEKDHIKALRLFQGVPVWTPHNRPADEMTARRQYLDRLHAGAFGAQA